MPGLKAATNTVRPHAPPMAKECPGVSLAPPGVKEEV